MPIFSKPQYSTVTARKKKDIPKDLFTRCPISGEMVYNRDLEENLMVVPKSGYHFPMSAPRRIESLVDDDTFEETETRLRSVDALKFTGASSYTDKLRQYEQKTGLLDPVVSGVGEIGGVRTALAVMDFRFLGASMGSVAGEKITRTYERALEERIPAIVISTSGGARMYEGILSLMQMAKTSAALARLGQAGLPYISVLTNPTTAGVMASFASLGDVILAEPGALIGFAGPRVIRETTREALPDGFQKSEFLLERGLLDDIVPRNELRDRLVHLLHVLYAGHPPAEEVTA